MSNSDGLTVFVVGSTGVLGRNVIPRLLERGHRVRALVRRPDQIAPLRYLGVETFMGDILDAASLLPAAQGCAAVLHLATAIPLEPGGDWTMNDRVRREGTRHLLAAALAGGARRYVQQSIVFLYGNQPAGALVDESAPLGGASAHAATVEMEAQVRASALDWCILRGGLFYGPGNHRDEVWRPQASRGELRLPGDGQGVISLIHVADMARAVVLAAEQAPASSVYNVVDDEPVTYRELYGYIAAQARGPEPQTGGESHLPSAACGNARLKAELGWAPAYPTYRSGLT